MVKTYPVLAGKYDTSTLDPSSTFSRSSFIKKTSVVKGVSGRKLLEGQVLKKAWTTRRHQEVHRNPHTLRQTDTPVMSQDIDPIG